MDCTAAFPRDNRFDIFYISNVFLDLQPLTFQPMSNTSIELNRLRTTYPEGSRFLTEEYHPPSPLSAHEYFPHSTSLEEDDIADNIYPPWKRNLFALLERPTSSPSAFLVYATTTTLIVISAIITVLETVPAFHFISTRVWFGIETSLVALFTIEYIARCFAWSTTWRSLFNWLFCQFIHTFPALTIYSSLLAFFGIVDLLSVMPYYIELLLQQDTVRSSSFVCLILMSILNSLFFSVFLFYACSGCSVFSVLSDIPILSFCEFSLIIPRLFECSFLSIGSTIEVMYLSVRRSQHALLALGFFVVMILTVFSTLLCGRIDPLFSFIMTFSLGISLNEEPGTRLYKHL